MRFATPVLAVIVAAILAGCGKLVPFKPNPAGDTAFIAAMQKICARTPPLEKITISAGAGAVTTAANNDNTAIINLQSELQKMALTLSSASPLAPAITRTAEFQVDAIRRYTSIVAAEQDLTKVSSEITSHSTPALLAEKATDEGNLAPWVRLAVLRADQAQAGYAQLGIATCIRF